MRDKSAPTRDSGLSMTMINNEISLLINIMYVYVYVKGDMILSSSPLLTNVGNEEYTLLYRPQERQLDALFLEKRLIVHLIPFQMTFSL